MPKDIVWFFILFWYSFEEDQLDFLTSGNQPRQRNQKNIFQRKKTTEVQWIDIEQRRIPGNWLCSAHHLFFSLCPAPSPVPVGRAIIQQKWKVQRIRYWLRAPPHVSWYGQFKHIILSIQKIPFSTYFNSQFFDSNFFFNYLLIPLYLVYSAAEICATDKGWRYWYK